MWQSGWAVGGAASHQPAGTDLLPLSLRPARLLQLQHHTMAPAGCQPAPLVLAPCDGALHMSGLQKDLGLGPSPLPPPTPATCSVLMTYSHLSVHSLSVPPSR